MAILQLPAVSLGVPVSPRDARKQPAHPVMVESLTPCELRVLELICEGHSNKEIALQLGVGLPTVKYHVYLIFRKLGASRRLAAHAGCGTGDSLATGMSGLAARHAAGQGDGAWLKRGPLGLRLSR